MGDNKDKRKIPLNQIIFGMDNLKRISYNTMTDKWNCLEIFHVILVGVGTVAHRRWNGKKGIDREAGGHSTWAIHEMATARAPPPPPPTKNRTTFLIFIRRRATRRRPRLNDDDDVWNPRPQSGNKKDRSSGSSIASRSVGFQEIFSFSIVAGTNAPAE